MKHSVLSSVFLITAVSLIFGTSEARGGRWHGHGNNGRIEPRGHYDPDGLREIRRPVVIVDEYDYSRPWWLSPQAEVVVIDNDNDSNSLFQIEKELADERYEDTLKERKASTDSQWEKEKKNLVPKNGVDEEKVQVEKKQPKKKEKLTKEVLRHLNHMIVSEGKNSTHDPELKDYVEYAKSKTLSDKEQNFFLFLSAVRYLYNNQDEDVQDAASYAYKHVSFLHNCDEQREEDCIYYLIVTKARDSTKIKSPSS